MKKKFRSLLALAMALAMILALTACGGSSTSETDTDEDTSSAYEEEPQYIEVSVGDVLYSDDNCSVTLASLETNDKGGSTLTLSVVNNYEGSLLINVCAYDTDEFNSEVEKYYASGSAYYKPTEQNGYFSEEGETEADWSYEFSGEYVYFSVDGWTYSEFLTQEQIDSGEYLDLEDKSLYSEMLSEMLLVNTAE